MNTESRRKIAAILRVLDEAGRPLGSTQIARGLRAAGFDLRDRMVRKYLEFADQQGLTVNLGRAGRQLTPLGRKELAASLVIEKVGFVDAHGDELAFRMTLDLAARRGTVIMNLSTVPRAYLAQARQIIAEVLRAGLGMGKVGVFAAPGETVLGTTAGPDEAVIGTVCSITFNGLLRAAGVPVISRFGGLLEVRDGRPARFTHLVYYAGTTLDPIEIFIKARMTSVTEAAKTGSGVIGASFREVPAVALPRVRQVIDQMTAAGLGGLVLVGEPSRALLEIPVEQGRAGIVISAGLNPLAAVHEQDIPTENRAMARLCDFSTLEPLV